jgi:hypothetical protein
MGYVYDKKADYEKAVNAYREAGNQSKVAEMQSKSAAKAQNVQADQEYGRRLAALELQIKELEAIGEIDEANELRKQLEQLKLPPVAP